MELQRDFYVGTVEDNKDPNRKGRIKVRIQTLYHNIPIEDIPYAYPFAGLAGKEFQVPAIGKLVNVLFLSDDLYSPYYIYSENYNTNLQNKLRDLSDEEYVNFVALLFDERTNIFADSEELTIDHRYNKITINNTSINHELKDNNQKINLGSKNSEQEAVLGTRFFEWMDKFIAELLKPHSLVDSAMAPISKPKLQMLCKEYQSIRKQKKSFTSDNVRIVDNGSVKKLERIPSTITDKHDIDLILAMLDEKDQCQDYREGENKEKEILDKAIKKQNKKACKQAKVSKPSVYVEPNTQSGDMIPPLTGRVTSKFGLRRDPTNKRKMQGHSGTDIAAPTGTPIYSPADGKVKYCGFDSKYGGGNSIRIKHTNDFTTGYAHLSSFAVLKGDKVKKGDIIGYVGNTGGHTTGPHLHFTLTTPDNVKVDPELYFDFSNGQSISQNDNNLKYQGQNYKQENAGCEEENNENSENDPDVESSPLSTEFSNDKFIEVTKKVIDNLEGGYWHPNMFLDGRLKKDSATMALYKTSTETMFGIDRQNSGSISQSPAGKEFWSIIDNANAADDWEWNYMGGEYRERLTTLAAEMMKPRYDTFADRYLSDAAEEIVNSDDKLLFNFSYATWNGPVYFQKYANEINDAVRRGETDVTVLRQLMLNSRLNSPEKLIANSAIKIRDRNLIT